MTSGPFEIRAAAEPRSAEILIYGDIGESWDGETVAARTFVADLAKVDADYLTVRINSYGGSVSDGIAIHNALKRHPAAVSVEIDGVAVSIASLIAMAGDTVRMADNALMMIHAPWSYARGNARDMRDMADTLDRYAAAMTGTYRRGGAIDDDTIAGWLTDGEDHWFTAAEAQAAGLIDEITGSLAVAASLPPRFRGIATTQEGRMADSKHEPAASPKPETNVTEITAKAKAEALAAIKARNETIKGRFDAFCAANPARRDDIRACYDAAVADTDQTPEQFTDAVLVKLAEQSEPVAGAHSTRVEGMMDEREKFRAGAGKWLAHRAGLAKDDDRGNQYRGMRLHEIAAASLRITGERTDGLTASELAGRVLAAHTTSDFPYLLADSARKSLQAAYDAFPSTWNMVAASGSVSDFKTINLARLGSFSSLAAKPEGAEYVAGTMSEEREQLTASTKGRFIQLSREMIINDDLDAFSRMAAMLGRAAARTVNADVYAVINANGNLSNGRALFNTTDGNLASSGGAISVSTLGAGRAAMRKQKDPSGNDYLNIMPRTLLVPVALEDHARTVLTSENDTDTTASRKRNPIRDWGPLEVVSDPYLDATSTTAWYLIADPMDVPALEVRFLDGNQSPFIDDTEEFLTDAIRWKVRLDYGVAANDRRGAYKNAGA